MNEYNFKCIQSLTRKAEEASCADTMRETMRTIIEFLFEDRKTNSDRNLDISMKVVLALIDRVLAEREKEKTLLIIEVMINLLIILQSEFGNYFHEYFQVVVLHFDDFDGNIQRATELLNNYLLDSMIANIDKMTVKTLYFIENILSYIRDSKNERVRMMILKWLTLLDSFPVCELSQYFQEIIKDLLYLFYDPNPEVVFVSVKKVDELFSRFMKNWTPNITTMKDILKIIYFVAEEVKPLHSPHTDALISKCYTHLIELTQQQMLHNDAEQKPKNFVVPLEMISLVLNDIYLKVLKKKNDSQLAKPFFRKMQGMFSQLVTKELLPPEKLSESVLQYYLKFIEKSRMRDLSILVEIKNLLVPVIKSEKVPLEQIQTLFKKCVWRICENNFHHKDKALFAQAIELSLKKISFKALCYRKSYISVFSESLFVQFFDDKRCTNILNYYQKSFLSFFLQNVKLFEILSKISELPSESDFNYRLFLHWLWRTLYSKPDELSMASKFIYSLPKTNKLRTALFEDPLLFVVMNVILKNYIIAHEILLFLNEEMSIKGNKFQILFSEKIYSMAEDIKELVYNERYSNDYLFIRFIVLVMMLIPQKPLFFDFRKVVKFKFSVAAMNTSISAENQAIIDSYIEERKS